MERFAEQSTWLPGVGPQGGTLGIEEYLSQTNGNTDFLKNDEKYKFIDKLSNLEILNLISIAFSYYDYQSHPYCISFQFLV